MELADGNYQERVVRWKNVRRGLLVEKCQGMVGRGKVTGWV